MPTLQLQLQTVSPLFLNGANSKGPPELRVASVRGQLRYWFRAIYGAKLGDLKGVSDAESETFGSTHFASPYSFRIFASDGVRTMDTALLPHQEGNRSSQSLAIRTRTALHLEVVARPGAAFSEPLLNAISTWLLLGGLGKRSRRAFGGIQISAASAYGNYRFDADVPPWWEAGFPSKPGTLIKMIQQHLNRVIGTGAPAFASAIPPFPTLHPKHARVMVCRQPFRSATEANIALFRELLRAPKYRAQEQMFGFVKPHRRASPLIAQVRRLDDAYFLVLTAMRSPLSAKPDVKVDWKLYNDFFTDAAALFKGDDAWGGPF